MVETYTTAFGKSLSPQPLERSIRRSIYLSLNLSLCFCLLVGLGHRFKWPILTTFVPAAPDMVPFTAAMFIGFIALIYLMMVQEKARPYLKLLLHTGLTVVIISNVLSLLSYNLPFALPFGPPAGFYSKLSSPQTLISFLLLAFSLWALSYKRYALSQVLALVVLFVASLMIFAYLTDVHEIYLFSRELNIGMAIPTSLNFGLLAYSLLALTAYQAFARVFLQDNQSGDLIRKFLLVLLLMSFLLAITVANLTHADRASVNLRLALFGSLNTFLMLAIVWGFARQFNRLELNLAEKSKQTALQNERLEQLNLQLQQANEKLKHNESFLYNVLDNLSEMVVVFDSQNRYLMVNQKRLELTGSQREDLLGKVPASLPERFDEHLNAVEKSVSSLEQTRNSPEGRLQKIMGLKYPDDSLQWFLLNAHLIPLADSSDGVIMSFTNITELQEAKRVLAERNEALERLNQELQEANLKIQQNEAFLNDVLNNLAESIFVVDQTGRSLYANSEAVKLTGQSRDDILDPANIQREQVFLDEQGERLSIEDYGIVRLMRNRQEALSKVMGYQREDGQLFWLKVNLNRLRLKDSSEGFLASYLDISEQIESKELLKIRNQQLERSNKELQDFAFVASHDLQEPLLKIRAFIDRLSDKEPHLSERSREYLQRMNGAALRMQTMIHDILELSRVSTRARAFERIDLNEVLEKVKLEFGPILREMQATLVAEPLPKLEADPSQMERLFTNLLSNALKYRKADEAPQISLRVQKKKSASGRYFCHLQFQDNGIGFNNEYRDKIFVMFQRLHGRNEYEGTGVGLAICRKIVERHGGTIEAYGEPGVGARFELVLPLKQLKES